MNGLSQPSRNEARAKLAHFLAGTERLFAHPTGHPTQPTGFCPCDGPLVVRAIFYVRATLLTLVLHTDFNLLKLWLLRRLGARIGRKVYLAPGIWIDPLFPQLLTLGDEVFIGSGARLMLHEFRTSEFVAGRLVIRQRAIIGAWALLGPGIEIGAGASVAAGAVVGRDVPAGCVALGNPVRIVKGPGELNAPRPGKHATDSRETADGA
jgi:acetyltransferase-like isoleucine patch superfamily enzyme